MKALCGGVNALADATQVLQTASDLSLAAPTAVVQHFWKSTERSWSHSGSDDQDELSVLSAAIRNSNSSGIVGVLNNLLDKAQTELDDEST